MADPAGCERRFGIHCNSGWGFPAIYSFSDSWLPARLTEVAAAWWSQLAVRVKTP